MTNDLSADVVCDHVRRAVFTLAEAQGVTRSQMCEALWDNRPMARSTLDTRRTGRTRFYAHELAQLAELFRVPVDALLRGDVEITQYQGDVHWRCGDAAGSRSLYSVLASFVTDGVRLPVHVGSGAGSGH